MEHHEERIDTILNHLDELPLERIEHIEDIIEGLGNGQVVIQQDSDQLETELHEARAQIAGFQRKQVGYDDEIVLTRVRTSTLEILIEDIQTRHQSYMKNLLDKIRTEGAVSLIRWFERTESVFSRSNYTKDCKVMFATGTLTIPKTARQEAVRAYPATPAKNSRYAGNLPLCRICVLHHTRPCTVKCNTCNKVGHLTKNYRNKGPATGSNLLLVIVTCHACGEKGHYANQCRKTTNNNAQGRAYMLRDRNAHQDPNVVMSMFLLNQHLARVLFDSGADKSFVSISLASMLNIPPITIDTFYNIEMADRNLVSTNTVIQGATLTLLNQPFEIDLMPIKLGSFDVVIGMDWLSKYHARIICDEKVVHIPINGETLIIRDYPNLGSYTKWEWSYINHHRYIRFKSKVLPPRTAEEILARERERKARTTLLMALPEDHLAKFHKRTDAKEMWDAIKSRFGGNDNQTDAESQVSLIIRTKPGVDSLSFDDLYNNIIVFENVVKGSAASSSSTQNVAFISENTSSTNDVSSAYGVSNPSGHHS
ncbi:reverse transcriptase domain-containing protein [Tanacetum coccineum]|uniref:Reverse transcriptase domain-containing protein n=1 Tax=Tanacetum coccineum TaxID=301880 RepID=A0ABQ5F3S8_9ASTR